ncbi:MAG: hypothetical protein IK115_06510 [Lachnospiraceae bacterium]|nr:hypothetical protein [Lachnospiraceae bacterium]
MGINGINENTSVYNANYNSAGTSKTQSKEESNQKNSEELAAVYEKNTSVKQEQKATYKVDQKQIDRLKADAESHKKQLQDIVDKLITKQGQAFDIANGKNLKNLYAGLKVDAKTRAQAQADISEDGYYGVKQTSQRIFDFAMALSGGDPDKMEKMRSAFEKGFRLATKSWGDKLPDICHQTYDAVQSLFDDYKNQQNTAADEL